LEKLGEMIRLDTRLGLLGGERSVLTRGYNRKEGVMKSH